MSKGILPSALILYRVKDQRFALQLDTLQQSLSECAYSSISPDAISCHGFSAPLGEGAVELFYRVPNVGVAFAITEEKKSIPPDEVAKRLDAAVKATESSEARLVRPRERRVLKQEIIMDMLPAAYSTRTRCTLVYLEALGMFAFCGASGANADKALALLRKALGSLPIVPVQCMGMNSKLIGLLRHDHSVVGASATLSRLTNSKDEVVFKNTDFIDRALVYVEEENYQVSQLELFASSLCSLIITDSYLVKGICWDGAYTIKAEVMADDAMRNLEDGEVDQTELIKIGSDYYMMISGLSSLIQWVDNLLPMVAATGEKKAS